MELEKIFNRIPPLGHILLLPIYLIVSVAIFVFVGSLCVLICIPAVICLVIGWLLGFWRCTWCKEIKWIGKYEKYNNPNAPLSDEYVCSDCYHGRKS